MEENLLSEYKKNWQSFLFIEKCLVKKYFTWINLLLDDRNRRLLGKGMLNIDGKDYEVLIEFSPFNLHRFDRIYIVGQDIKYNEKIHLYNDMSLCLYHPIIDKPFLQTVPLSRMIPWISEWIIFYEQWKKYGVWLGKEIDH